MVKKAYILGISAYYHDSAAALLENGKIVAACQEERFSRIKGDSSFPHQAIAYCLDGIGISVEDVDYIVFYENPYAKFDRLISTYHLTAPKGLKSFMRSMPSWLTSKLWLERTIANELGVKKQIQFCDHHLSHAASAFYPSSFAESAILTVDGVGEWSTTTCGVGRDNKIELLKHIRFPNSVGLLYSAFTYYTGFKINSGEYKLMGLAPYGQPKYVDIIKEKLVKINDDGSLLLNQEYFDYATGLTMTNTKFDALMGGSARKPEALITQREMDIAASIQTVLNEIVLKLGKNVFETTGLPNLVLAGGVALNVVANNILSEKGPFEKIWIQPAAGDAGGAVGCALWYWHMVMKMPRLIELPDSMNNAFLGYEIGHDSQNDDYILNKLGANWTVLEEEQLQNKIAEKIAHGKIVAIARGKAEFGPRALGARSILADARRPEMQSHLNLKVKFRESFRPFAPIVLVEDAKDYFDCKQASPYMLFCAPVVEGRRLPADNKEAFGIDLIKQLRSDIPAVTHVDYSARLQTVDQSTNPFIYGLLKKFKNMTNCSVLVNTSFNVRGEPIVNTAEDAYRCFMATDIDCLVIGNRFFAKENQASKSLNEQERQAWLRRFELD